MGAKASIFNQHCSVYLIFTLISCLLVSCGDSKAVQCSKVNQVVENEKTISASVNSDKLVDTATKLDSVVAELDGVKVGDGNLQNSQKALVDNYKNLSQSIRNVDAAIGKPEVKNIKTSLKELERVTDQKKLFIEEINKYCTSK